MIRCGIANSRKETIMHGTNRAPQYGLEAFDTAVVARSIDELPVRQRQKITNELMRIHKIVSAHDIDNSKDSTQDKAEKP
jgi:hypothetical protein